MSDIHRNYNTKLLNQYHAFLEQTEKLATAIQNTLDALRNHILDINPHILRKNTLVYIYVGGDTTPQKAIILDHQFDFDNGRVTHYIMKYHESGENSSVRIIQHTSDPIMLAK